jgi:NAD(P)-dependent dehydrogenase (short-subunit alcohol dehydrogenase family)
MLSRGVRIDLSGQVVVVTGAGRGIGRETAKLAAEAGARAVLCARTVPQLEEAAAEIRAAGGDAVAIETDVASGESVKAMVSQVLERFGQIDVLVNNAGTNAIANLVMAKEESWRQVYEVNVFGTMRCTQAAVRAMIRRKSGRVINVSSVSAKVGAAYNSAYASSKAAVLGFTKSVAREVAKIGITVNAILPWHVDTELVQESMTARAKMFGKTAEEYLAEIVAESPQQRLITAREVAALAVFLMSHEARGITGQCLNVCGGTVME